MIKNFLHKGLKKFFYKGIRTGLDSRYIDLIETRLFALDNAKTLDDINLPGYKLHKLSDNRLSIFVSAN